jgi:HupE / UreJ protein
MNFARALLLVAFALFPLASALAHPLGNNTVNRQSAITVGSDGIALRYVMDLAEIPTLLESQAADRDQNGTVSMDEWENYAAGWATAVQARLALSLDGEPLPIRLQRQSHRVLSGDADLAILRLEAVYFAQVGSAKSVGRLEFRDDYQVERRGWREIFIAANDGAQIADATVPAADRSKSLTDFAVPASARAPNELRASAQITFAASTGRSAVAVDGTARTTRSNATTPPIAPTESWGRTAWEFFKLGVHHIATGWDHLVFLAGLLLLSRSIRNLVKIITAFTIAHSVTLALASAGLVAPPSEFVEPAIALTIAYVGWIALPTRARCHGTWLAFAFGLVHGFGFAGALAETLAGAQETAKLWLVSLASFNVGIEVFQIALVCALVPLMRVVERTSWSALAHRGAAVAVLTAGVSWFFVRALA